MHLTHENGWVREKRTVDYKYGRKFSWICFVVGLAERVIALLVVALWLVPYELYAVILRDFPFSLFLALFVFAIYLFPLVRKIKGRTKGTRS